MTRTKFAAFTFALGLAAGMATPAAAAELGNGFTINGGATVVSDYRFRGISQTDRRFAVQGTFTLAHSSGFYATVWGSSIDNYVAARIRSGDRSGRRLPPHLGRHHGRCRRALLLLSGRRGADRRL